MGEQYNYTVLSEFADATVRSLMVIRSDFERASSVDSFNWLPELRTTRVLDSIVRCIGLTEFFVFTRIATLVDEYVERSANRMLSAIYKQQASKLDSTWQSIVKAARDYIDVSICDLPGYEKMMAFTDVPNAALHGNGSLTRRQLKDAVVEKRLETIDVNVMQGRLVVRPEHLFTAVGACRALVTGVDSKTWASPSGLG